MDYIAGGATQNSIRVAQWMLQVRSLPPSGPGPAAPQPPAGPCMWAPCTLLLCTKQGDVGGDKRDPHGPKGMLACRLLLKLCHPPTCPPQKLRSLHVLRPGCQDAEAMHPLAAAAS